MNLRNTNSPLKNGYRFPAEWEKHAATWLSYPHNENSWPGRIQNIFPAYHQFIKELSRGEVVNINVNDTLMLDHVKEQLTALGTDMNNIRFYIHPTNDAWCRDHGPAFLINPDAKNKLLVVNWEYNAWGNKYPYELDNKIPQLIAEKLQLPVISPDIVMEGGSVDFNGKGSLITTKACLLNPNRNPKLNQTQIETYLYDYYGVHQIIWLNEGVDGDDTNGHVDDICRFVNEDTVVTVVEKDKKDFNYKPLQENLKELQKVRLINGKQLNIIELPMPEALYIEDQRVPCSYANFYIANAAVIVPVFGCKTDEIALDILAECFTDRMVIGIDSSEIIWGLGSFHCLSQQQPMV
ncbi:MAG: agmatine deiminase family protein [Bacteroidetes bacterium]|nr:agmatine deiminase family protein [Bacteroidota bacterium]